MSPKKKTDNEEPESENAEVEAQAPEAAPEAEAAAPEPEAEAAGGVIARLLQLFLSHRLVHETSGLLQDYPRGLHELRQVHRGFDERIARDLELPPDARVALRQNPSELLPQLLGDGRIERR